MATNSITYNYVSTKYINEYINIDDNTKITIANELSQAVSDYQSVNTSLNEVENTIIRATQQKEQTAIKLDNTYKSSVSNPNSNQVMGLMDDMNSYDNTIIDSNNSKSDLMKAKTFLEERISYLKSLLSGYNKLTPTYIPFNPKLEAGDFNRIAHFRVLESFHSLLRDYLTPGASILDFKSKLFYAAVDSDTSFRFTMLPLFIQEITYGSIDKTQISPLIGDYFHSQFFGRAEQSITISAYLLDTPETNAFATITMLYMDFFRITHVSRVGIPLTLEMGDKLFTGAFTSMNINKNSVTEDLMHVTFEFLVLEYTAFSEYNRLAINNVHTVTW